MLMYICIYTILMRPLYQHEHALNILQTEKTELMYKCRHCVFKKKTENPMKKVSRSTMFYVKLFRFQFQRNIYNNFYQ